MSVVIQVDSLWKKYRLGVLGTGTLRHDLNRWLHQVMGKPDPYSMVGQPGRAETGKLNSDKEPPPAAFTPHPSKDPSPLREDEMWAVRGVSFAAKQGEAIGIIGRNGAGKSTLLKILSRTTAPTHGEVRVKGRIASLLEVGTGFHPELTGKENIFLNGAILGMTKKEIKNKLDAIAAFAEVDDYLDTPVKRYSSGMYVRLAFAVAAHLDPEILIVDEVLAVGDAAFQKKCLGKMDDVTKQGRTILFVSHNMAAISQLCSTALLLESGRVQALDQASKVVGQYLSAGRTSHTSVDLNSFKLRTGTQNVRFEWAELQNAAHKPCREFSIGDDITIRFGVRSTGSFMGRMVKLAVELRASDGLLLANMIDVDSGFQIQALRERETLSVCLKDVRLYPDTYYLSLTACDMSSTEAYDHVEDCLSIRVLNGGRLTSRSLTKATGLLFLTPEWKRAS